MNKRRASSKSIAPSWRWTTAPSKTPRWLNRRQRRHSRCRTRRVTWNKSSACSNWRAHFPRRRARRPESASSPPRRRPSAVHGSGWQAAIPAPRAAARPPRDRPVPTTMNGKNFNNCGTEFVTAPKRAELSRSRLTGLCPQPIRNCGTEFVTAPGPLPHPSPARGRGGQIA